MKKQNHKNRVLFNANPGDPCTLTDPEIERSQRRYESMTTGTRILRVIVANDNRDDKKGAEECKTVNGESKGEDVDTTLNLLMTLLEVTNNAAVLAGAASMAAHASDAVESTLNELGIKSEEQQDALAGLWTVLERRLPQIATALVIETLLPLMQDRAFCHFRFGRRESKEDSWDLSQTLVTNILDALYGKWPNGNVGAWVSAIRQNQYADHNRKRARGREAFERIESTWRAMRR